ncbi:MAG TPA: DUF1003 domain-containing protein [Steroidobacteraceae bacterium]|nr:DUF1003 domain-containing protein [Steroidobacteraceae bacterium]
MSEVDHEPSSAREPAPSSADSLPEHISQNIDSIIDFRRREEFKLSDAQRRLERLARWLGRPLYLLHAISLAALWLLYNALAPRLQLHQFDPPPFFWLQGLVSLAAFLTTTVVLISQNRQAQFEAHRLNFELQLNLLTEQKTTKLIHLLEELRHDLPMVHDRHDAVAAVMQTPTDPRQVLEALEEQSSDQAAKPHA